MSKTTNDNVSLTEEEFFNLASSLGKWVRQFGVERDQSDLRRLLAQAKRSEFYHGLLLQVLAAADVPENIKNMINQSLEKAFEVGVEAMRLIQKLPQTNFVRFKYTNWKGESGERRVRPFSVYFGHTEWHPEDQWLLSAFDYDKNAYRDFAIKDISELTLENRIDLIENSDLQKIELYSKRLAASILAKEPLKEHLSPILLEQLVRAAKREKLFKKTLDDLNSNYDEDEKYDHCPIRKARLALEAGDKI